MSGNGRAEALKQAAEAWGAFYRNLLIEGGEISTDEADAQVVIALAEWLLR